MRARKKKLGDWYKNGSEDREPKRSLLPHEVCSEIDEYKRGAATSGSKKLMAVLGNGVQNLTQFLKLFQRMLCHPSHIVHTLLHMADRP